jgi:hypothetical protein
MNKLDTENIDMQNNKVSVKELNEFLIDGKLSEFGTFSEVDIVFVAGLFLLYMQNRDNWTKIPQLFNIGESSNAWNHSHYFRQIDDLYGVKHNQIFDKFPNAYNKDANPVSRFFAPPIYITNRSIDYFFETEKSNKRIDGLKGKYIKFFDISDFVDKTYNSYKKSTQEFEEYTIKIQQRLEVIAPVFVFIFIVACKRLAKKEDRKFEETKEFVEKIWQFTQTYTNGLHELARNIVEHSGQGENNGQGMITIRAYSGTSTDNEKIKVLETHVFDYGEKGIYETLKQNTEKNKTDNEDDIYTQDFKVLDDKENKYTIKDFIEPTDDNKKFLLQQFFREMAHYGLMSFKDLIARFNGKIIASSVRVDEDSKRELYVFSENNVTKEELEEREIKKGTSYYFELPFIPSLFEREKEEIKERGNQLEVSALSEIKNIILLEYDNIKNYQPDDEKKYILNLKVSTSLKETGIDKIDNREVENDICYNFIKKINSPDVLKFKKYCFSFDFIDVPINKSNLLRILAKISREKLSDFIVYNIDCSVFTRLIKDNEQWFEKLNDKKDYKKDYIKDKKIETSYWLKEKSILFFTKYEKIQEEDSFYFADILFGETSEDFYSINKMVSNTFPNATYINRDKDKKIEIDDNFSIPQKLQINYLYRDSTYLLPFDTILKRKGKELFLYNIKTILKNDLFRNPSKKTIDIFDEYLNNVDGYRIKKTHFKIGNKVHSADFYYAKRFFQNSFYTTRLAMYFARILNININNPKTKITLLGYEMYSELILSLIEKFLKENNKNLDVNHFVAHYEGEKMTFLPKDNFNDYLSKFKERKIIIVVPIAATGNTTKKIKTEIINQYKEKTAKILNNANFTLYNIIMAQDKSPKFKGIRNDDNSPLIIDLPATWYNIKDCQLCFGIDENGKPVETIPLFDTDNSSLTPSIIFGNPKGKKSDNIKDEEKNNIEFDSLNFENPMNYQSVERNDNYRIYDIDSDIFINVNMKEIEGWLINTVKRKLEEKGKISPTDRVVIVAPCHESNSQFINLVNEKVFTSAATIIHHQNGVDFVENFSLLNEKNLNDKNTKIFYVDDSLITGKHFFELFDLIREVTGSLQPLTASILINDQAVPFVHDQVRKLSNEYFPFVIFNQPSTRNILNERPLEHEQKRYELLQKNALHDALCEHFYLKAQKLIPEKRKKEREVSSEKKIRHLKLFEATHKIYDYFAQDKNLPDLTNEEERNNFVDFKLKHKKNEHEVNEKDTNTKALLKVLSQYPFILYKDLKMKTFIWHKEILKEIISNPLNEKCFDIDKDYYGNHEYDNSFTTFKFHLRRAAFLDNYQVLEIDFLKKLLMWFVKIDKYFAQNNIDDLHKLPLFSNNNYDDKLEKKNKKLRDFPIFVLGNYIEMIQKNGWAAYKILKNIKQTDFSKSNLGRQFLLMLQIESACVIDGFVEMLKKEYGFMKQDVYNEQNELDTGTDRILKFFDKEQDLKITNKYKSVKDTFFYEYSDLKNIPFVNYLWIKQFLYADSIDKNKNKQSEYKKEINEIINKMKHFFPDSEKVNAFFIVTDGQKVPHVLSSDNSSLFSNFKYEYKELLKADNKEEWPTKILIDILNGESGNMNDSPETTAEFVFKDKKWKNLYYKDDNRNIKFISEKYKWLYLIRISELKEYSNVEYKFEVQGLLGFYSTEDLSESILPKQLIMLLRKDISEFINKHHKNDEFAELIRQEEKNKYVVKLNHGVQTYENTIEYQFKDKFKDNLEENVKTLLKYLANKIHLISLLNSDDCGKTENITLGELEKEFKNTYKFVFSLPIQTIDRIEKTNIDDIVQFNVKFNDPNLQYSFPAKSYKDIIFEILLNIRRYGIGNNTFTSSDQMINNITVEDINGNKFLTISNTYKGDLGRFENLNNDNEPHGIDLLKQLWHSYSLGKVDIISPTSESHIFKLLIQLKESKDESKT